MDIVSQAFSRTQGRLQRLFDTISEEYWKTHKTVSRHGCSLLPGGISNRACKVATVFVALVMLITLPLIMFRRGFSQPSLYTGLGIMFLVSWLMFYAMVWIAHVLWATSYMLGSKFGGSRYFWGFIEKRWSDRIDKITEEFLQKHQQVLIKGFKDEAEKEAKEEDETEDEIEDEAEEEDARNANDNNN